MTDRQLAILLIEKVADAKIDKKIAVFINRLMLRLHSQPSYLASLADVVVFKPGSKQETDDQIEDGQFHESEDEESATNQPVKEEEDEDPNEVVIVQFSFRRLPQEVISPLIRLIAAPREPRLMRYSKEGSARLGIELELKPSDFPGEEYDYSF